MKAILLAVIGLALVGPALSQPGEEISATGLTQLQPEPLSTSIQPRQLLQKMIEAQRLHSYRGALAYERSGTLSTFSLTSRASDASMLQSLQPLNRQSSSRLVFDGCSAQSAETLATRLSQLYNFYLTGESRVAGRPAHELLLLPLDPYRYGYGFSIDQSSQLMLRTLVMTTQREPLERIEFVDLELSPGEQSVAGAGSCAERVNSVSGWALENRPAGFELVEERGGEPAQQVKLVYSDGLSTVTVMLDPVERSMFPSLTTRLGATNVLLTYARTPQGLHRVTLVGEVPLRSLELMAHGLQYNGVVESPTGVAQ